jgi:hypothetical protein
MLTVGVSAIRIDVRPATSTPLQSFKLFHAVEADGVGQKALLTSLASWLLQAALQCKQLRREALRSLSRLAAVSGELMSHDWCLMRLFGSFVVTAAFVRVTCVRFSLPMNMTVDYFLVDSIAHIPAHGDCVLIVSLRCSLDRVSVCLQAPSPLRLI